MGFKIRIDPLAGVIFSVGAGLIGKQEIQHLRETFLSDPGYRPGLNHLVCLKAARLRISGNDARCLAKWAVEKKPVGRLALVVGPESHGFAQMYQGWAQEGQAVRVFCDTDAAREWLGLPPAKAG